MKKLIVIIALFVYLTINVKAQNKQNVADLVNQAVAGDAKAQTQLFFTYMSKQDPQKAFKWLKKAANKGEPFAEYYLGTAYYEGVPNVIKKDKKKGIAWVIKSAKHGIPLAQIQVLLWSLIGIIEDNPKPGFDLTHLTKSKYPPAFAFLGVMSQNGFGVAKDEKKAFNYYKVAAKGGSPRGMMHLAGCYRYGIGTRKDIKKADDWDRKKKAAGKNVVKIYDMRELYCLISCINNLKQIGLSLRMYSNVYMEAFPKPNGAAGVEELRKKGFLEDTRVYICRSSNVRPAAKNSPLTDKTVSYVYRGGLTEAASVDDPIAWDKPGNHINGGCALYVDGHVTFYTGKDWMGKAGVPKSMRKPKKTSPSKRATNAVIAGLKRQILPLLKAEKYDEALKLLRDYDGKLAHETHSIRMDLAVQVEEKLKNLKPK